MSVFIIIGYSEFEGVGATAEVLMGCSGTVSGSSITKIPGVLGNVSIKIKAFGCV